MAGTLKEIGTPVRPQVFDCSSCGAALEISALGATNTIVCKKCSSIIDIGHPLFKVLRKQSRLENYEFSIPIGSFGIIRGEKYKVIGLVVREDTKYSVNWREYLLFNPYLGFRFLFEIDNHYTLLKRVNSDPGSLIAQNQIGTPHFEFPPYGEFKLYNRGRAKVVFAVGEFYWRVRVGAESALTDYICPPYIFSIEQSPDEINLTFGDYLPTEEIQTAFSLAKNVEIKPAWTTGQNQPNPYQGVYSFNLKVWGQSMAALFLIYVLFAAMQSSQLIKQFSLVDADLRKNNNTFISEPFEVPGRVGNIEAAIYAPVKNEWLEAEINLVNEASGEGVSAVTGVEFYSGIDSDGYWTEGDTRSSKIFSSVPGGRYNVQISTSSNMPKQNLDLKLTRNGSMLWNFILCLLFVSIYPVWMLWRYRSFEITRWENSDYSPYFSSADSGSDYESIEA